MKDYDPFMKPDKSLSHRVVQGGFWVFGLRIIQQGFNFIRLIILARVLAPHDFGLMGIALLTMTTIETFSQTGFQTALIQKKESIRTYLDCAWTVSVLRGFVLSGILFFLALVASDFFNSPEAKPIIQVIGVSILIQSLGNIGVVYFQKDLEFNKQFVYELAGTIADFVVVVSSVLILRNVWALVLGLLAGNSARCFASYLVHPYRPRLNLDLQKVRELWGFGRWVLGSSILIFLITHGDDIFVGKLLGASALGFYQMAYRISNMPATEITHVISQVTFPAYSKIQDNMHKLREAYLRILRMTAFLSFPISGLIFVLAPDFTIIFLEEKWMAMVPAMQVLVFWGLIRSIGATTGPVMYAIGRPEILTKYQILQLIMLAISIYPLTLYWGIFGASCAVLVASMWANTLAFYATIKITNCGILNFVKTIGFPLVSSLVATVLQLILKKVWIIQNSSLALFILSLTFYGLVYLGVTYLLDRFLAIRIKTLAKVVFSTMLRS
jgi:O-antigen/teichoic acid export membrane protein